jgi:uncharacterized protein with GYD domain
LKPCGDKAIVFCRQFAKIKEYKDGVCELEDFTEAAFATVKEYTEKVEELKKALEAAGAVAGEAAEMAMEGDMMMDPPMMEADAAM